jgi:hypothetical protein
LSASASNPPSVGAGVGWEIARSRDGRTAANGEALQRMSSRTPAGERGCSQTGGVNNGKLAYAWVRPLAAHYGPDWLGAP